MKKKVQGAENSECTASIHRHYYYINIIITTVLHSCVEYKNVYIVMLWFPQHTESSGWPKNSHLFAVIEEDHLSSSSKVLYFTLLYFTSLNSVQFEECGFYPEP